MPNPNTFSVKPIGDFVRRYVERSKVSVDPFARDKDIATYTNDINPKTKAKHHMDAEEFIELLMSDGIVCDLGILDPPYSPRQISECYKDAGIPVTMKDTQNSALYKRVKDALHKIIPVGGTVISFGWNTSGMGKGRGYEIIEIMTVCHGGAHNDTICVAEKRVS